MSQEEFGAEAKTERLSEQDSAVLAWFQEQGFAVSAGDQEGILEAFSALEDDARRTGEDVIASAPAGLEDFMTRLQSPAVESQESAELPLAEMAAYLSEKTGSEISADNTVLMTSIYLNLKGGARGASGTFGTNPETDPLFDLSASLTRAFEALLEETDFEDRDMAA